MARSESGGGEAPRFRGSETDAPISIDMLFAYGLHRCVQLLIQAVKLCGLKITTSQSLMSMHVHAMYNTTASACFALSFCPRQFFEYSWRPSACSALARYAHQNSNLQSLRKFCAPGTSSSTFSIFYGRQQTLLKRKLIPTRSSAALALTLHDGWGLWATIATAASLSRVQTPLSIHIWDHISCSADQHEPCSSSGARKG